MNKPGTHASPSALAAVALLACCGSRPVPAAEAEGVAPCLEPDVTPLAYGDHTTGCAIGSAADSDALSFAGQAAERVRIVILSTTTSTYDPQLELRDCAGALAGQAGCTNNFCSATFETTLGCTGDHTVVVTDGGANETGAYVLQLERLSPPHDQALLAYGESAGDAVDPATDIDRYRFYGEPGRRVRLVLGSTTSAGFDPRVEVRDPGGAPIDDASCSNNFCTLARELAPAVAGFHSVFVSDAGAGDSGGYDLALTCLAGPCDSDGNGVPDPDPALLLYDQPASGTVARGVDVVAFRFQAVAGTPIRLTAGSTTSAGFDPLLEVYDPLGNALASASCQNGFCTVALDLVPPLTGAYGLFVSDAGSSEPGGFDLNLECGLGLCDSDGDGVFDGEAPLVPFDTSLARTISPGVEVDQYLFQGDLGTTLRISVASTTSAGFDPQLDLLDPAGALAHSAGCQNNFCAFSFDFAPAGTGAHTIVISDLGSNDPGGYSLLVECLTGSCTTPPAALDRDNCVWIANGPLIPDAGGHSQRDTDADGFGNVCDPDLSNDLLVNFTDLGLLRGVFFTSDAHADFDGNGSVNFGDLGRMKELFFLPPGPSALPCAGTIPCP